MNQPNWKCIAQLGDANPVVHGGAWVFVDQDGNYDPELEIYYPESGEAYRIVCEKCFWTDGVLSDNKYHKNHPAWFADKLDNVSRCTDVDHDNLIDLLCCDSPILRAQAYMDLVSYFGAHEFDQYPLTLTRFEAVNRYRQKRFQCLNST